MEKLTTVSSQPRSTRSVPSSLVALFTETVQARPTAVAIADGATTLTYGALDQAAHRLAVALRASGVRRGDRVGLSVERGAPAVIGILGILMTGSCYVPLDPHYPADRLRFTCEDAELRCIISDDPTAPLLPAPRLVLRELLSEPPPGSTAGFEEPVNRDDLAYIIYTSGSTGQPKGVTVTHGNVLALLEATLSLFDFTADDRWSLFHSYSFDVSVWEMWGPIATGATAIGVPADAAASPDTFAALLEQQAVTVLNQVPSVFTHLVRAYLRCGAPALSLRYVVFAGEALDRAPIRAFRSARPDLAIRWVNMYGITETTVHVTFKELTATDIADDGPTPIGGALPHLGMMIMDEKLQPCRDGDVGELWVYGEGVAAGYLNRPELTRERFVTVPQGKTSIRCYRSGDLVRRRGDGELDYLGRLDDQIKIRGFRIELPEIENAIRQHPSIEQAAVVKVESAVGPALVAVVVPRDAAEAPETTALRSFLGNRLPSHMLPNRVAAVDALPLSPSGKVDRRRVAALADSSSQPPAAS